MSSNRDDILFQPIFEAIDRLLAQEKERIVVAIDGGSASGKTTLAAMLGEIYGCTVLHVDDFFLRPEQRSESRYAEVGGNFDRERFTDEVLDPLSEGRPIDYRRFDCSSMTVLPAVRIIPKRLTVVEGVYSTHPELIRYYDLTIFLDVDKELRKERIKKRNGSQATRFFDEWIPLEERYFCQTAAAKRCDILIKS